MKLLNTFILVLWVCMQCFPQAKMIDMAEDEKLYFEPHSSAGRYASYQHDQPNTKILSAEPLRQDWNLSFASYYGDHMVLQKEPHKAQVWGYIPNDPTVTAKSVHVEVSMVKNSSFVYHKAYQAPVRKGPMAGKKTWWVTMDPMPAGGPYTIQANIGSYLSDTITDVYFGDVWLCSGQSNMQFTVDMMFNGTEELKNAHLYPQIRLFAVAQDSSNDPRYELTPLEKWTLPSQESIGIKDRYFSAVCWLYGKHLNEKFGYPIGLIQSVWGGTPVEAWSSPDALRSCGLKETTGMTYIENRWPEEADGIFDITAGPPPQNFSVLWNAMINPLLPMTIYGAIWYQGEQDSNTEEMYNRYNCTFPAMVADWRKKFSQAGDTDSEFPFGFVQLAPDRMDKSLTYGFSDIRWHQTLDMGYVPNSKTTNMFMAVAMDLPDPNSPYTAIHPRDKITVGERLALSGLHVAYDDTSIKHYQGPFPSKLTLDTKAATLDIGYDQDIEVRVSAGFEVCCQESCPMSGHDWEAAPIVSNTTTSITLSLKACNGTDPSAVRYAWLESPCPYKLCAIYTAGYDLPGPPFIKDIV